MNKKIYPLKVYFDICIIKYFLDIISPNNDMLDKMNSLIYVSHQPLHTRQCNQGKEPSVVYLDLFYMPYLSCLLLQRYIK